MKTLHCCVRMEQGKPIIFTDSPDVSPGRVECVDECGHSEANLEYMRRLPLAAAMQRQFPRPRCQYRRFLVFRPRLLSNRRRNLFLIIVSNCNLDIIFTSFFVYK